MLSDHAELAAQPQADSWLRSRRSARRSGRGAAGGPSVDPDTAAPVDCGTFLAALSAPH